MNASIRIAIVSHDASVKEVVLHTCHEIGVGVVMDM
jgi:hypothetical protein